MKLITKEIQTKLMANGKASEAAIMDDGNTPDHKPVLKLFTPWGAATWLISECDAEEPNRLFGLCDLGQGSPELGYVWLPELTSVRGPAGLTIERDMHWKANATLTQYADAARAQGRIMDSLPENT